jgi:large subunit ribosomal protein L24
MQKIRKGDTVQVIGGTDRGKRGRVLAVDLEGSRIRVEGVRMQTRHMKPGRKGARQGGIIEREGYLHASNVMLVSPADDKPSRIRIEVRDGRRVRVFARDGELVPDALR